VILEVKLIDDIPFLQFAQFRTCEQTRKFSQHISKEKCGSPRFGEKKIVAAETWSPHVFIIVDGI
jgi:hypothetical protein